MVFSTDIIRELNLDDLAQMADICKKYLPATACAYHYLFNFIHWHQQCKNEEQFVKNVISEKCKVKFYGHTSGNIDNCTFFAISTEKDYCVYAYTLQESAEEFRDCLRQTRRVKWDLKPLLLFLEIPLLKELQKTLFLDCVLHIPCYVFYFPREQALRLKWTTPDGCYIDRLKQEHAKIVYDAWPYHYVGSADYIQTVINMNRGFGIFGKNSNELLSWVVINDYFSVGFLHTISEAKRKGYGEILTKAATYYMAKDHGLGGLMYTSKENIPAIKLAEKLGFERIKSCVWMKVDHCTILND